MKFASNWQPSHERDRSADPSPFRGKAVADGWWRFLGAAGLIAVIGLCDPCGQLLKPTAAAADHEPVTVADLRVPAGYTIEKVASAPIVERPSLVGFDDRGRLYLCESAGTNLPADKLLEQLPDHVRCIEDTNGDGVFDKSWIFADKLTFPNGMLVYRNAVYLASPPSIWKLEDLDGDGVCDRRTELITKFGFNGNGCDLHGCFLSPTGRLYFVEGRHGHTFCRADGSVWSQGRAGRIFSCLPDGGDIRIHAGGGMDNPIEVDFTPEGDVLGTVNLFYERRGDCLVHWLEGGVYPREDQGDCVAEFPRTGPLLTEVVNLGHVAVSGCCRYRSGAIEPLRDKWLLAEFNTHRVRVATVTRQGSTWKATYEPLVECDHPDFHPTDVLEDADGSVLVVDTGGWFRIGCPTSQIAKPEVLGGIYRIRRDDMTTIQDPRGALLVQQAPAVSVAAEHLADSRPAVVERSIETLAVDPNSDSVVKAIRPLFALSKLASVTARQGAVAVIARRTDRASLGLLREWGLNDGPPADAEQRQPAELRQLVLLAVGERLPLDAKLAAAVLADLQHAHPAVRREAANTLSWWCRTDRRSQALIQPASLGGPNEATLLRATRQQLTQQALAALTRDDVDRSLEHALIAALIRGGDDHELRTGLAAAAPAIRRAALMALDQRDQFDLTNPGDDWAKTPRVAADDVLAVLDSDVADLQQTALEILARRSDWARDAHGRLAGWLTEANLPPARQAVLRGFISAQLYESSVQETLAAVLSDPQSPAASVNLILEVLPRARQNPGHWDHSLAAVMRHPVTGLAVQATRVAQSLGRDSLPECVAVAAAIAGQPTTPTLLKLEAWAFVANDSPAGDSDRFQSIMAALTESTALEEQLAAAKCLQTTTILPEQWLTVVGTLPRCNPVLLPGVLAAIERSTDLRVGESLLKVLENDGVREQIPPERLGRLFDRFPSAIQSRASELLKRSGIDVGAQAARVADAERRLAAHHEPDLTRGRELFFGRRANCGQCHAVGPQGGRVGPDLSTIGASRGARDLLEAILYPSASFARGYEPFAVTLTDGRSLTGMIVRESSTTVTFRQADLSEVRIERSEIEEQVAAATSIMPKGLDQQLSEEEFLDLMAYLRSLK